MSTPPRNLARGRGEEGETSPNNNQSVVSGAANIHILNNAETLELDRLRTEVTEQQMRILELEERIKNHAHAGNTSHNENFPHQPSGPRQTQFAQRQDHNTNTLLNERASMQNQILTLGHTITEWSNLFTQRDHLYHSIREDRMSPVDRVQWTRLQKNVGKTVPQSKEYFHALRAELAHLNAIYLPPIGSERYQAREYRTRKDSAILEGASEVTQAFRMWLVEVESRLHEILVLNNVELERDINACGGDFGALQQFLVLTPTCSEFFARVDERDREGYFGDSLFGRFLRMFIWMDNSLQEGDEMVDDEPQSGPRVNGESDGKSNEMAIKDEFEDDKRFPYLFSLPIADVKEQRGVAFDGFTDNQGTKSSWIDDPSSQVEIKSLTETDYHRLILELLMTLKCAATPQDPTTLRKDTIDLLDLSTRMTNELAELRKSNATLEGLVEKTRLERDEPQIKTVDITKEKDNFYTERYLAQVVSDQNNNDLTVMRVETKTNGQKTIEISSDESSDGELNDEELAELRALRRAAEESESDQDVESNGNAVIELNSDERDDDQLNDEELAELLAARKAAGELEPEQNIDEQEEEAMASEEQDDEIGDEQEEELLEDRQTKSKQSHHDSEDVGSRSDKSTDNDIDEDQESLGRSSSSTESSSYQITRLQNRIDILEMQLKECREHGEAAQTRNAESRAYIMELREANSQLQQHLSRVQPQLEECQAHRKRLETENRTHQDGVRQMREKYEETMQQVRRPSNEDGKSRSFSRENEADTEVQSVEEEEPSGDQGTLPSITNDETDNHHTINHRARMTLSLDRYSFLRAGAPSPEVCRPSHETNHSSDDAGREISNADEDLLNDPEDHSVSSNSIQSSRNFGHESDENSELSLSLFKSPSPKSHRPEDTVSLPGREEVLENEKEEETEQEDLYDDIFDYGYTTEEEVEEQRVEEEEVEEEEVEEEEVEEEEVEEEEMIEKEEVEEEEIEEEEIEEDEVEEIQRSDGQYDAELVDQRKKEEEDEEEEGEGDDDDEEREDEEENEEEEEEEEEDSPAAPISPPEPILPTINPRTGRPVRSTRAQNPSYARNGSATATEVQARTRARSRTASAKPESATGSPSRSHRSRARTTRSPKTKDKDATYVSPSAKKKSSSKSTPRSQKRQREEDSSDNEEDEDSSSDSDSDSDSDEDDDDVRPKATPKKISSPGSKRKRGSPVKQKSNKKQKQNDDDLEEFTSDELQQSSPGQSDTKSERGNAKPSPNKKRKTRPAAKTTRRKGANGKNEEVAVQYEDQDENENEEDVERETSESEQSPPLPKSKATKKLTTSRQASRRAPARKKGKK